MTAREAWAEAAITEPRPGDAELDAPFAAPEGRPWLEAYRETWALVAWKPGRFFARARIDRAGTAVVFGAASASLGLFLSSFYSVVNYRHWIDLSKDLPERGESLFQQQLLPFLATGFSLAEGASISVSWLRR